jgi:hypothetical protein
MKLHARVFVLGVAALVLPVALRAQSATTGLISGTVLDAKGAPMANVPVEVIDELKGTRYTAVTQDDGRFVILNVRAGGPYAVTATPVGLPEQRVAVDVPLGEERAVVLRREPPQGETRVASGPSPHSLSESRTGPTASISESIIRNLPSVGRVTPDFARLFPYFTATPAGASGDLPSNVVTAAGRNTRYNNVQVDGAVNNDVFGLADSGTPGGLTETQPLALDAVQELQVLVAPYDVRQGGFTGGALNAVTRSGTNQWSGTAYYFFRNDGLTGEGPDRRPISDFGDKLLGAAVSGPIKKDKAFFFLSGDLGRKNTPSGYSADGSSGIPFGHEEVDRVLAGARSLYGYDPGGKGEFTRETNGNRFLGKVDLELGASHRLSLRQSTRSSNNHVGASSSTLYRFPDAYYEVRNTTHSSVAQLNSVFGGRATNELRLTYQRIRDERDGPTEFPATQVRLSDGSSVVFGRETFSTANATDQDIVELTDDLTLTRGNHQITIGTHNEFFDFRNLFIRDSFGSYTFTSVANFEAGLAQEYDHTFSTTGDQLEAARFRVFQLGLYGSDAWRVRPGLTLTLGLRLDAPIFPDKPTANPDAVALFGQSTDVAPSQVMLSPRVGFNWDMGGSGQQRLRGGSGIFAGRTPYVWLSNQYANTGVEFTRVGAALGAANRIPFVTDVDRQPTTVQGANANTLAPEIDVIDPDYAFPQVWRTTLGLDRELGVLGLVGTAEVLYSRTLDDVDFSNLNIAPTGATRPDGRPVFARVTSAQGEVIQLRNTSQGHQWTFNTRVERPFKDGFYLTAGYLYGDSTSVNDGPSSLAASNWASAPTPGSPNDVPEGRSRWASGHRVTMAAARQWSFGKRADVLVSLYYNGQPGRPYSVVTSGDWNGDGRGTNDLLYVPRDASEVIVRNGTWDQLDAFIQGDPGLSAHRGEIVPKQAAFGPWVNTLDVRAALGLPHGKSRLEVTVDVLNFLNVLNRDWGTVDYASSADLSPIPVSLDPATGRMVYDIATLAAPTFRKFARDDLRSRWQAQIGLRYRFN